MSRRRDPKALGRRLRMLGAATAAAALLASCSVAQSYLSVVQGTSAYRRGSYQEATVHYLRAQKGDSHSARVAYDLGNVYHALGEPQGAETEWSRAQKTKDPQVLTATLFNEGVLDYELGHYRKAYERFRKVLEMTPGDINAKIDLELSFEKMTSRRAPPPASSRAQPVKVRHTTREEHQLLDIIRNDQKGYFVPPPPTQARRGVPNW